MITNYSFSPQTAQTIESFLAFGLFLETGLDDELRNNLTTSTGQNVLNNLAELCIQNAYPYTFHPVLQKLNFCFQKNLSPDYSRFLREHILISAAYSSAVDKSSKVNILALATKLADKSGYAKDPNRYIYYKIKESKANSTFYLLIRDSGKLPNNDGKKVPKLKPLETDIDVIYHFIKHSRIDPYNRKFYYTPYTYSLLSKFVNAIQHMFLSNYDGIPTDRGLNNKLFNNFLLERLTNFQLITYLVDKMNSTPRTLTLDDNTLESILVTLSELAALPNVFSRTEIAEMLFRLYFEKYNENYIEWRADVQQFVALISRCTIPVLNLYFQFILLKTETLIEVCNNRNDCPKAIKDWHGVDFFGRYVELISNRPRYNIFYPCQHAEDRTLRKVVVKQAIIPRSHKNVVDKFRLCEKISKSIFFGMTSPLGDNLTIDCNRFFREQQIREKQAQAVQQLMSKPYKDL